MIYFIYLGGSLEPVVVLEDLYSAKHHGMASSELTKNKKPQQSDAEHPYEENVLTEEKYWEQRPENKKTPKWYKWQKIMAKRERNKRNYREKKARLAQAPWEELTEKEKMARIRAQEKEMKDKIKEQKEKEDRENNRKRAERSRLRARLEEQYYMSKLEQGLSMEEAHMIGSLNEGNADPNKRDADIANLDKKILESFKRHKKNIEKLRNERHEMEKQRLRDRLEQEYYESQKKTKNSQDGTVEATASSAGQSHDVQVVGTGQEFVIVKQEDSGESSDSESSDSNSSQEDAGEITESDSNRPSVGGLNLGRIWVPQTSSENCDSSVSQAAEEELCGQNTNTPSLGGLAKIIPEVSQTDGAGQENKDSDTNEMEPIMKQELLN